MEMYLWSGLFLPLLGFITLLFPLPRKTVHVIGCGSIFLSFLSFCTLALNNVEGSFTLFQWIPTMNIDLSFYLDHLALLMTLIVTGIGFLIHVYSIGYMAHDEDIGRYFSVMNFFIFSMLTLVLGAHLLVLFIGWEGVGLASYLLIGYWYKKPEAALAATKAFVVNRIGDLGLLLGILFAISTYGTGNIQEITRNVSFGVPLIAALFFWGATGKSAQLPLHVWLPDAMEGPTPVSALIHAATMVTAGVYLIVRMHAIIPPEVLTIIGYVGGATALFAALSAISQSDLKRVLAYSTISQLGLMFLAIGVEAYYAAIFHLTTHAFIKALLFLSAGNVIHLLDGETQMAKMGGLAKAFPKTNICFLIGVLAMSGLPPFAAFFSKDLILEEEFASGYWTLYFTGLSVSILTAFYLSRAYLLTFCGPKPVSVVKEEAPSVMLQPVIILALLSTLGGFLGYTLHHYLSTLCEEKGFHICTETLIPIFCALFGIMSAYFFYNLRSIPLLKNSFYVDVLYNNVLVLPLKKIGSIVSNALEPALFTTTINGSTTLTSTTALLLQKIQSGQIRSYIVWILFGAAFLILLGIT